MPQLWMIAGPNGAGKSTLTAKYLEGRLEIVNPDVIARELDPTDPHGSQVRVQAGRKAIRRQNALLSQGTDFAVETTLSGNRELVLLRRAKEAGYKVTLVYVGVGTTATSRIRVQQRVGQGGHSVPYEDIQRRYPRSMANLAPALRIVDRAFVLDNGSRRYRLLFSMDRGRVKRVSRNLPAWARDAIPREMRRNRDLE